MQERTEHRGITGIANFVVGYSEFAPRSVRKKRIFVRALGKKSLVASGHHHVGAFIEIQLEPSRELNRRLEGIRFHSLRTDSLYQQITRLAVADLRCDRCRKPLVFTQL